MSANIQTVLHVYRYDIGDAAQLAEYDAMCARIRASWSMPALTPWSVQYVGDYSHDKSAHEFNDKLKALAPSAPVEIETAHLFADQWNTAPVAGFDSGIRVFRWSENKYPNRSIRAGYWLEDREELRAILRDTTKCGFCGAYGKAAGLPAFCGACLDSEYLKVTELHLLRMRPIVDDDKRANRAPLTAEESAHLVPLFNAAQLHGTTERGKARIAANRARVENDYARTLEKARISRDGGRWLLDNAPGMFGNCIFYSHTGRWSFGWNKKLSAGEVSALLDVVTEFPFPYDIECDDGRKLSGER